MKSLLALAILATVCGCKGGSNEPDAGLNEDQKAISDLVYKVADTAGKVGIPTGLDQFRALYAKDKAPSSTEAAKYKDYMFYVVGDITVSGNTATFTTGIEKGGEEASTVVEKPWKAVKEADGWKLAETPLP